MKRRLTAARLALPAIVLVLAGCASVPQLARRAAPDWVFEPPPATDRYEYFVAVGTDSTGDAEAAQAQAAGALLTQINQVLGVDVTVLTTAEARASLESYEASVLQEVRQSAEGRVDGFRVADRYMEEDGSRVTVHLLGEYERPALETERAKRRALLAAREALLLASEREADEAAASGRAGEALLGYLRAADRAARAGRELRIAPVVLERSLRKATSVAEGLAIRAVSGPGETYTGDEPGEPVRFAVVDGRGGPVGGMAVELSYPVSAGRTVSVRRESVVTGQDGFVAHSLPPPGRVGEVRVTARIDLDAAGPMLGALPESVRAQRAALEELLAAPRATWRYDAVSRARTVPTTLVVVETDAAGTPMPSRRTSDGISEALLGAGFNLVVSDPDSFAGMDLGAGDLLRELQNRLPAAARRVVYGEATIAEFAEGDGYLVKVSATVTTVDLNTGQVIHSMSAVKNARSASADQALNTAFLQLGRSIGEELAASLP